MDAERVTGYNEHQPINKSVTGEIYMTDTPFAIQIWTLREAYGEDMPATLQAVKEMGYQGVELCRWYDWTDLFDKCSAEEIKAVCEQIDLKVVSSHVPYTMIQEEKLSELAAFSRVVGMNYAIVASLPEELTRSRAAWKEAATQFNIAAAALKSEGIQIGYHNHGVEFQPIDGQKPWDIFFDNTDPEVIMQLDIGNSLSGGADPYDYLEKYPGRATLVHMKDYDSEQEIRVLGDGAVDWGRVIDLCERFQHPEWYIVEQESQTATPFESAKLSLQYLRGLSW
jgi:sugar phosphate isomerase/epimerase